MSFQDQGLLVFGQSGTDHVRDASYDSRLGRMQTDLTRKPPHLALIDDFPAGTALHNVANQTVREEILTIPHGLPFTPEALVYMYVKSVNGNKADPNAGIYSANALFLSGASGTLEDVVSLEVDDTNIKLVHTVTDFDFGVSWTSPAPGWLLRIKYYIFSNPAHVQKYGFNDGGLSGIVG